MTSGALQPQHLMELLAGEAAGDLSAQEASELSALYRAGQPAGRYDLMRTAALVQVAFLRADRRRPAPMPAALENRLMQQAERWCAAHIPARAVTDTPSTRPALRQPMGPAPARARRWLSPAWAGWYLAAALAVAFVAVRSGPGTVPVESTAVERRAALVRSADDLMILPWGRSTEPGFENVTGDVVWSSARQEGYMRLAGLPANQPTQSQYQLWIIDPERDTHPVDGGVFDVPTGGEVIIPVQAKLPIGRPTAFALTLEKPGGVVVSDGPLLVVTAAGS